MLKQPSYSVCALIALVSTSLALTSCFSGGGGCVVGGSGAVVLGPKGTAGTANAMHPLFGSKPQGLSTCPPHA
jgi:hypothetical protein